MQPNTDALESAQGLSNHTAHSFSNLDWGRKRVELKWETREQGPTSSLYSDSLRNGMTFWQHSKRPLLVPYLSILFWSKWSIDRAFFLVFQILVNRILRLFTKHSVFLFLCLAVTIHWFVHCKQTEQLWDNVSYNALHSKSYSIVADLLP